MYEELYHILFNAMTDAIELLHDGNREEALQVLIQAQQKSEDRYIRWEEK